jgi:glycerol-3-phosphate dehydrogenase
MTNKTYDVAIVGGGIHGAGIAQACAAAGYTCIIIEKDQWAAGTSQKSSKLIHGGLRYLESAQFSLVRESLRERNILLKIAPSLVKPLAFSIPIYKHSNRPAWKIRLGLIFYALIAGLNPLSYFKKFSPHSNSVSPLLKKEGLLSVFQYWDAQTDDRLLTQAVIKSACQLGVQALEQTALTNANYSTNGYELTLLNNEKSSKVFCKFLVNAAGPWCNDVFDTIKPTAKPLAIELVKGSHLILSNQLSDQAFYLESPSDKRAIFALPWYGKTLLGTTEQIFTGDPDEVDISTQEMDYLLATLTYYFPEADTSIDSYFAGLRVLPTGDGSAFSRPRECILYQTTEQPNAVTIYGGKLTAYRSTAEKVVKLIAKHIGSKKVIADTKNIELI